MVPAKVTIHRAEGEALREGIDVAKKRLLAITSFAKKNGLAAGEYERSLSCLKELDEELYHYVLKERDNFGQKYKPSEGEVRLVPYQCQHLKAALELSAREDENLIKANESDMPADLIGQLRERAAVKREMLRDQAFDGQDGDALLVRWGMGGAPFAGLVVGG